MPEAVSLSEVAQLWKLAAVLVVAGFLFFYRTQLRLMLERGFRFRHRDTELESAPPPPDQTERPSIGEGEEMADPERPPKTVSPPDEETESPDEPEATPTHGRVLAATARGDAEEARRIFDEIQDREKDTAERRRNEVLFAGIRLRWGRETTAADELREATDDEELGSLAHRMLAFHYEDSGYPEKALVEYEAAVAKARTDEARAYSASGIAGSLQSLGRSDEAIDAIRKGLASVESPADRRHLYGELANVFEARGDWLNRGIALEKALELDPTDRSMRFRAGWAYAQADHDDIALLHYLAAMEIDSEDQGSRNNSGVAYERLGMPIKSVGMYSAASKAGNTLASANLAQRLMTAGFVDEAREELRVAREADDPHPNVGGAAARLAELQEGEDATEKEVISRAQVKGRFFRDYGEAAFANATVTTKHSGTWMRSDGTMLGVEWPSEGIELVWSERSVRHVARGTLAGRAFSYDEEVEEYSLAKSGMDFVKKYSGRGFVSVDGREIDVLRDVSDAAVQALTFVGPGAGPNA